MATVSLKGIKKRFAGTEVIHGVSADISDGEFIVIVGPSGCGKSTLLRMVAGLETISEGTVMIGEREVNDMEPMDRDIAMVFQNYALYPHMSVRKNMGYSLKIAGLSKAEITHKVDEAARLLQLSDYLDRKPKDLSGGQRQRVAMGRAIVREPAVFLFDEPLSNLDAKLRVQMRLEIKSLQSRLGVTALYVTHDQVEAMTMADRMIVMNAGHVEQIGSPLDVYERPATRFAAQFIGSPSMNIVDATLSNGQATLSNGQVVGYTGDYSGSAWVGLRPEHILPDSAPDSGTHQLIMQVEHSEPLGANTLLHGRLEGISEPFTVSIPGVYSAREQMTLPLRIDPDNVHVFDKETGRRL